MHHGMMWPYYLGVLMYTDAWRPGHGVESWPHGVMMHGVMAAWRHDAWSHGRMAS